MFTAADLPPALIGTTMMSLLLALSFSPLLGTAAPAIAAATPGSSTAIPLQFRGRWAENPRACRGGDQDHPIITIETDGYSAPMTLEGRVISIGPVRGGTHTFGVAASVGPQELDGRLTLRRAGGRLAMTVSVVGEPRVRHTLIRCR
jgi:hypothetical protein